MAENALSFTRDVVVGSGHLEIQQCYIGDVGCVVWDAALVLTKFLEHNSYFPDGFWKGKRVLELGAGTGIVGLGAAALGYDSILHLFHMCPCLHDGVDLNYHI